jgi:hypothetical protein
VAAWLRVEQARELTVLRAHQARGAALIWLLGLAAGERLVVRLVSPEPLDALTANRPEVEMSGPGPLHPGCSSLGNDQRELTLNIPLHLGLPAADNILMAGGAGKRMGGGS